MKTYRPFAVYTKIQDGKVSETKEFGPDVFCDYDEKGNLLGIELLSLDGLGMLAKVIRDDERESCAKIADAEWDKWNGSEAHVCEWIAKVIRDRGNQ